MLIKKTDFFTESEFGILYSLPFNAEKGKIIWNKKVFLSD